MPLKHLWLTAYAAACAGLTNPGSLLYVFISQCHLVRQDLTKSTDTMLRPLPGEPPEWIPTRELEILKEWQSQVAAYDECDRLIYVTTGEFYRDEQEEGRLVVQRAPYEVRPQIDTGVSYIRSEADHKYDMSLNNSPRQPEYNWNSVRLDDTRHICQACGDVFNYYCRYFEARLKVCRSFETLISHEANLESIKRSQRKIARDSNSLTPSCTISTFFLWLPGRILPNVTYVKYF